MNWLRNLLGRPAEKKMPPPPSQRGDTAPPWPAPAVNLPRLRQALALAASPEERQARERELGRALALAHQSPGAEDGPAVWVEAICHAEDKASAAEWTRRLQGDAAFAEIARRGRFSELRQEAARRITETDFLEQVAEHSRDRDKGVYRYCTETLRRRRQAAERARHASELALTLMELLETQPLPVSKMLDAERELRSLGDGGDELAECKRLLEQARARVLEEAESVRNVQEQQAQAQALLDETLAKPWPEAQRADEWQARADAFVAVALPPWMADHAAAAAFEVVLRRIAERLTELRSEARRAHDCAELLDSFEGGSVGEAQRAAWAQMPKPENPLSLSFLESRWQSLQPPPATIAEAPVAPEIAPESRLQADESATSAAPQAAEAAPPPKRAAVDMTALQGLLDTLEQHLEEGHLADAEGMAKRIDQTLAGAAAPGAAGRRLSRAHGQIARLRGWARWGTDQAREHLIEAAEALLAAEPDVDERARAVPALRKEWKALDAHAPASKGQWERFDTALEKAYEPVAEHRAQLAAQHDAARAVREALLGDWEAWLAGIVWEHADIKVVQVRRQEMLTEWRGAPATGFRDERALRKRLDALLAAIDARIAEASSQEMQRREQLIADVEAQREGTDIGRAIATAKSAQERWREQAGNVRLARGDEQALWQRFRAACDAVFARRDAQRAEQDAQRSAQRQARQQVLEEFEAKLESENLSELEHALGAFRTAWNQGADGPRERSAPPREGNELDQRGRAALQRGRQRIEALRFARHRARFDLMARKHQLLQEIEGAALAGELDAQRLESYRQAWQALPKLPAKAERGLADRLEAAPGISAAALEAGRGQRENLLLDLEIALGLPSPQAQSQARRARSLDSLQNRFKGSAPHAADAEALLAQWYGIAATADAGHDARIEAIVRQLAQSAGGESGQET